MASLRLDYWDARGDVELNRDLVKRETLLREKHKKDSPPWLSCNESVQHYEKKIKDAEVLLAQKAKEIAELQSMAAEHYRVWKLAKLQVKALGKGSNQN